MRTAHRLGLLYVTAAATCLTGCGWMSRESVQAARVEKSAIREFVDERGTTSLPTVYVISTPFAGRIQPILKEVGSPVSAGPQADPVAQMVPDDLREEKAEAQAAVDRLKASIVENQFMAVEQNLYQQALHYVDSMQEAVKAAARQTEASKRSYEYAESFFAETARLAKTDVRTDDDVQRADVERVAREVDYYKSNRYTQAAEAINAATRLLPAIVKSYIERKQLGTSVLEKQLAEAQARLRQAEIRETRAVMHSPIQGVVLEKMIENEQYLAAGTQLLKIGDLSQLEIVAEVLSQDVVQIHAGDPVEIYGPATGRNLGDGFQGVVKRVHPAGFTKLSSLGVEQQRVKVIVAFAAGELDRLFQERPLGVDYRVRVRIFTASKKNALTIPRTALFRGADGGWQVFAVCNGAAELTPVTVGLGNDDRVEITDGLQAGATVVLAPESSLVDGAAVEPKVRPETSPSLETPDAS
ncbi:efflux RND transporter periplasmic adaptor subunit [Lignipirellula cremea]|uniref:Macrolide export protein MacA n=1 Tax=Lignipirellula cremea TaxID=2528010 RepID=A0A518DS15_9BACT|nr:efflux RND transporter periplasmic adaptor subunit [Lignipirellula cremea]QDU94626.1 Macrolide export protein MacA [Lignipirellula cremea]